MPESEPSSTRALPQSRAFEPVDLAHLPEPTTAVVDSHLHVARQPRAGTPTARHYLCTLPAGSLILPLNLEGYIFTATPTAESAGLAPNGVDAAAVELWQSAVVRAPFMVSPSSSETTIVRTGETVLLAANATATARRALWAAAEGEFLRIETKSQEHGQDVAHLSALPLGPRWLVVACDDVEVRGLTAAELLVARGLDAVEGAGRHWARHAAAWLEAELARELAHAQASLARSEKSFERALEHIAAAAEGIDGAAVPAQLLYDPLLAALALVGQSQGIAITAPTQDNVDRSQVQHLMRISQASHFRFREIALKGDWWQEEGLPLLGFDLEQNPLALLPEKKGYRRVDPQSGESLAIDAEVAAQISTRCYMLYATFPDALSARTMAGFAFDFVRADFWWMLGAALLVALLGLLVPIVTGILVNRVIPEGQTRLLVELVFVLVAVAIGSTLFRIIQGLATARVNSLVDLRIQPAIWDRVMRLPSSFFRKFGVGDLAMRVLGIKQIGMLLSSTVVGGLLAGIMAFTNFFVMAYLDLQLTVFATAYALAVVIILGILTRAQLDWQRRNFALRGEVENLVIPVLNSIPKLRVAAAEERTFARWAEVYSRERVTQTHALKIRNVNTTLMTVLPIIGTLGIFILAGFGSSRLNLGVFVAFYAAFGQFMAATLTFSQAVSSSLIIFPIFDRLRPVIEAQPEITPDRQDPGRLSGAISVRDVSFRYSADGPMVLENVSFEVEPGQFVAVVGPSGAGKSTILRLLLGFEQSDEGAVYYDGKDLQKLDLLQVRRQIGTVLQDVGLIPGSIYQNIAGASPLTRDDVLEALQMAGMGEDIKEMPMGLETMVSEGGGNISGGQRQRLMIARVLVHKPQIIFFDEATSALDNQTQATVTESLEQFHTTRLVIAHRLSTIRGADKILVVEKGRIAQQGSYEQLMAEDGLFRRLAERQIA